jgi:hypothetical protein
LVGKAQAGEVLVTGWRRRAAQHTHEVTARWPARHAFYTQRSARFSPLLFTETVRQALGLLAHTAYGVPLEYRMGWDSYHSTVAADALWAGDAASEIVMTVSHRAPGPRRARGPVRLAARVSTVRDGRHLGTTEIRYIALPPVLYNRLRGPGANATRAFARALPPGRAVPAHRLDRGLEDQVVLSPTSQPDLWQLRTDTSQNVLFDHPHDHVPGMVLLEAVWQAALLSCGTAGAVLTEMSAEFHRYIEFDRPCWIRTTGLLSSPEGLTHTRVRGVQDGQDAFTAVVSALS